MTKLGYYPGCSLRHSAAEFDSSTRTVLEALGFDLEMVPDWTCCGASPAHMTDHLLAEALAARNLRQGALVSDEMVAPCPACYQRQKSTSVHLQADPALRAEVNAIMDAPYTDDVRVFNLPELLVERVGLEALAAVVKVDLSQLKVVPYYGCLLGRPVELLGEENDEQPMKMDQLLAAAGADVKWWNYKTECCGASIGVPKKIIQQVLTRRIFEQALHAGADAIVTCCPLCHQNLDLRQPQVNSHFGTDFSIPVLYLPQVIGLALGFTADEMMLDKHVIDPRPLVQRAIAQAGELKAEEERKAAEKAAKAKAKADEAAAPAAESAPPSEAGAEATGEPAAAAVAVAEPAEPAASTDSETPEVAS